MWLPLYTPRTWRYHYGTSYQSFATTPNSTTHGFGLRPLIEIDIEKVKLSLLGSGSSGNPYILIKDKTRAA